MVPKAVFLLLVLVSQGNYSDVLDLTFPWSENYSLCHLCLTVAVSWHPRSQADYGAFYILGPFSFIIFNALYQCPICTSVANALSVSPWDSRPSNSHNLSRLARVAALLSHVLVARLSTPVSRPVSPAALPPAHPKTFFVLLRISLPVCSRLYFQSPWLLTKR